MSYPSDLSDEQWEIIKDHFKFGRYGNRSTHDKRQLVNAVFYLTKTGCQWRQLPKDFPFWSTVHSFYFRMKKRGIWEKMMRDLVKKSRVNMGRTPDPTYSLRNCIHEMSLFSPLPLWERSCCEAARVRGL